MSLLRLIVLYIALSLGFSAHAALVSVPALEKHVTDLTGTLDAGQQSALEAKLQSLEASKGSQIAVLIVPTTQPEDIAQYAIRVAEQWKIGRKGIDDGVILLVAKQDRKLRIEVGYGLEGAIPDAYAKRIIAERISPRFKQGDYYGGLNDGLDQVISLISGEPLPAPKQAQRSSNNLSFDSLIGLFLVFCITVGSFLTDRLGSFFGASVTGGLFGGLTWMLANPLSMALFAGFAALLFTLFIPVLFSSGGVARGGYYGGGSSGSSGSWGSGSDSWGGGGGSFGGGGASGDW